MYTHTIWAILFNYKSNFIRIKIFIYFFFQPKSTNKNYVLLTNNPKFLKLVIWVGLNNY